MDSGDSDEEFPIELPKFNRYSYITVKRGTKRLLNRQFDALNHLCNWFDKDDPEIALVRMPTGSGKTGIISCLPYFLGKLGLEPPTGASFPSGKPRYLFDKPVLIIAPSLEISDQLEDQVLNYERNFFSKFEIIPKERREALPEGIKIKETAQLKGPDSRGLLSGKDVIIANAQKFLEKETWEKDLPDDMFSLVIVDEAHHHPATTWKRIINKFKSNALVVFFTATPFRADKLPVVPGESAYTLSLADAIAERIIRPTVFEHEETDLKSCPVEISDEPSPEMVEERNLFWTILETVRKVQDEKNERFPLPHDTPHMAFAITGSTDQADKTAEMWNKAWGEESAIAYHSKVNDWKTKRPELFRKIKENQVRLVVLVEMLLEGFDHPPVSIAAIMTKITSPVKFVQFIGRAQRIFREREVLEDESIVANIVSHSRFEQRENFDKFQEEDFLIIAD